MAKIARKSDGRRIFTEKFKREQIARVIRGELTLAELSRKLGIARSLLHRWKRLMPHLDVHPRMGGSSRTAGSRGFATSEPRATEYIRELQQLLGKQTVELELLRAEMEELKNRRTRP
jgi:transposase-like protein